MYKIILDNKVIDVVDKPRFLKFLPFGHIALTDRSSATGIVGSDDQTIYSFISDTDATYPVVSIKEIDQIEFNRLHSLLNSRKEVCADESILAKAKRVRLQSLSNTCKNNITSGFSAKLSDGKLYHFKLTAEDQLNLLSLENLFNAGETLFIYHATNEPCNIFSREDMDRILKAYRHHLLYHTTYFNVAKQYINSLTSVDDVNKFSYGTDVTQAIDNVTLKQLLRNGEML